MGAQIAILAALLLSAQGAPDKACDVDLEAWLACNNPRAIRYLSALSEADIGTVLNGVKLTNGTFVAKGYRLLGLPKPASKGAHIVVIHRPRRSPATEKTTSGFLPRGEGAFVWVDSGGDSVPLPECPPSPFENQYVPSGDVYTWKAVQPDDGVVEVGCIIPSWKQSEAE